MDEAIARLNIEHFQKQLASEKDEAKRQTLQRLLAEEERKLVAIQKDKSEPRKSALKLFAVPPLAPMGWLDLAPMGWQDEDSLAWFQA